MAYSGNKFLFDDIIADENDDLSGMELLGERLQEMSESDNPDWQLKYQKTKEDGKDGYNIQLPGGADFHIENGKITFSKFGMSKDELKEVYSYLNALSISGLSFDPAEPEDFKQTAREAREELKDENHAFASGSFFGASMADDNRIEQEITNAAANSNVPQQPTGEMTDEERLAAARHAAEALKDRVIAKRPRIKEEKPHPNRDDILKYMNTHVKNMQKDKSNNYRIRSYGNGWEMTWYKDSDQKKEGPTADKKGRVNPNFEFALRGEIVNNKDGQPNLHLTMMTPKYGDMADWMMEEVLEAAKTCKCTHVRFNASYQHKSKFFTACGKKMMIPTGVNLKEKDINNMLKAAKENNDDPKKRADFYLLLADQVEEQMRKQQITDEAHPFVRIVKDLRDSAKNEAASNRAQVKYKKFNQFFENNIMDKFFNDENDKQEAEPDAVKEIAGANAYVRFLKEYKKSDRLDNLPDEDKLKLFKQYYNEEIYLVDKSLSASLGELYKDENPAPDVIERREKLLANQYKQARNKVNNLAKNIKQDAGVDVDTISLQESEYLPWVKDENGNKVNPNRKRMAKGRAIHDRNMANSPMNRRMQQTR